MPEDELTANYTLSDSFSVQKPTGKFQSWLRKMKLK